MDPVLELFSRMDKWRHFPNYQLERRADIFFSLYLTEVIERKLGFSMCPDLAPEFPVRVGALQKYIDTDESNDKSYKIDYLALSTTRDQPVLVELKTESASRRDKQDDYLKAARDVGLEALLEGLLAIFKATNAKRKYFALMLHLERMGLLQIPQALTKIMNGQRLQGATEASADIVITAPLMKPRIVYVQPNNDSPESDRDFVIITFHEFADVVARHPDAVSQRFAASLHKWVMVRAGGENETEISFPLNNRLSTDKPLTAKED